MLEQHNKQEHTDKTPPMGVKPVASQLTRNEHTGSNILVDQDTYYLESMHKKSLVKLSSFPFTIGRDSACDLTIDSELVSAHHVSIQSKNSAIIIKNEATGYDVEVNQHRIQQVILQDGDEIEIGREVFIFFVKPLSNHDVTDTLRHQPQPQLKPQNEQEETLASKIDEKPANQGKKRITWIIVLSVSLIAIAGYQYYQHKLNERVFVMGEKKQIAATDQPENTQKDSSEKTVEVIENNPEQSDDLLAPMTPNENKGFDHEPLVIPEPTSEDIKIAQEKVQADNKNNANQDKIQTKTRKIEYGKAKAQKTLNNAVNLYHKGNYDQSIMLLSKISKNTRFNIKVRKQSKRLIQQINELNQSYLQTLVFFENQNKHTALESGEQFLNKYTQYFELTENSFVQKIKNNLATEYERQGTQLYSDGNTAKAYQYLKKAHVLKASLTTNSLLKQMDTTFKNHYRTGYRFETVNLTRSLEYWNQLLTMAPVDHPYYLKAAAKIKRYQHKQQGS